MTREVFQIEHSKLEIQSAKTDIRVAKVPSAGSYDTLHTAEQCYSERADSGLADIAAATTVLEAQSVGRASLLKNDSEREAKYSYMHERGGRGRERKIQSSIHFISTAVPNLRIDDSTNGGPMSVPLRVNQKKNVVLQSGKCCLWIDPKWQS